MMWNLCFITKNISDYNIFYRGGGTLFPLYIDNEDNIQFNENIGRKPNLNIAIVEKISLSLGLQFIEEKDEKEDTFSPIDVFDYIYATLHSPLYREKNKEYLKTEYPRIPYPDDKENFNKLVKFGAELRKIHLFESPIIEEYISSYPENGSNEVEKVNYENENVWINSQQYFENVPQIAWEFYIGGYLYCTHRVRQIC